MYDRILVPLDGSALAAQILPYVHTLSHAMQVPLELMRIIDPVPEALSDPAHGLYLDQLATTFRNQAEDSLREYVRSLEHLDVEVSYSAHEGGAASTIVSEAENTQGTLIAMSTHGRSGVGRWVMGSVTDKVLHASSRPLLIVRGRPEEAAEFHAKMESIVVPLDGSALAERVLPHAVAISRALGARIRLVSVIPSEQSHAHEEDHLRQMGERLVQDGAHSFEPHVLHGEPARAIVDMTHDYPHALVAITTHGRSGIGHWVLGSVTDRVVRYSGSPVLVVRSA